MKKNLTIICCLACLMCFIFVLMGCDQAPERAAKPKVIRKKIHAKTDRKAAPPKTKLVTKPQPMPGAKPAVTPSAPEKQVPEKPLLAANSKPSDAQNKKATRPKPPVSPKSDISMTRAPAAQTPAGKSAPGQPATPTASSTAIAKTSSKDRPIYSPKGKIDPFEPLFRETPALAGGKAKPKKRTPRTPLERIDISQLKLVGIILASSGNRALVEESNGKGYVIKTGTYIGTNSGKVVKIEKDKVVVAEEWEDVLGNVSLRNKEIKLPKPPGDL
jgi:type IV pilus assembly protein PilP